jgi:hypothetical protein
MIAPGGLCPQVRYLIEGLARRAQPHHVGAWLEPGRGAVVACPVGPRLGAQRVGELQERPEVWALWIIRDARLNVITVSESVKADRQHLFEQIVHRPITLLKM